MRRLFSLAENQLGSFEKTSAQQRMRKVSDGLFARTDGAAPSSCARDLRPEDEPDPMHLFVTAAKSPTTFE
jgi:hypothetical protein